MSKNNAIAFITDPYYSGLTSVAITSLIKNYRSNIAYDIFILYDKLSNNDIKKLMSLSIKNIKIHMVPIDDRFEVDFAKSNTPGYTLYKFLLYKLINSYDKILFCDSDIIFNDDISDIFEINLENNYAAVVKDAYRIMLKNDNIRLGIDTYFNTGIMLMNLKKMREEDSFSKLIEIKNNIRSPYVDQDVFNIYFNKFVVYLNWRFNYFSLNTQLDYKDLMCIYGEFPNPNGARIIHYTDGDIKTKQAKFWNYEKWEKYYKASPYGGLQVRHTKIIKPTVSAPANSPSKKMWFGSIYKKIFDAFYVPIKDELVGYFNQKFDKNSRIISTEANGIKFRNTLAKNDILRFMAFLMRPIRPNSILLVEGASCHAETLPGFVTLFQDLGYNVDVIVTESNYDLEPFSRLDTQNVSVFYGDIPTVKESLRLEKISEYEHVFFNSRCLYLDVNKTKRPFFYEYFTNMHKPKGKIISLEHHQEYLPKEFNDIVILDDLSDDNSMSDKEVHPYRIGTVNITPKNKHNVEFISIGNFENKRKDHPLLFKNIEKILNTGRTNFHVHLIGRTGDDLKIPGKIADFVTIKRRLKYTECYECMEQADFFLPLLNPDIPGHLRYLKHGSTGSLQLIYSFAKPCIIHRQYGEKYKISEASSIQYDGNNLFSEAMIRAIEMPCDEYSEMQNELLLIRDLKYAQSLINMKKILST